jgi:hypothetical protein
MNALVLVAMISTSVGRTEENVAQILTKENVAQIVTEENVAQIVTEVTRHIHAGCVYLLHEKSSGKRFINISLLVTHSRQIIYALSSNF